jgi:serine phosphatase RsbU (regulator of sigma subunit)
MARGEPEFSSGLEIAGLCLPAAGNLTGGDWYDVVPLPAGRIGVVVGDVMGHGPGAAALMAELRAAAHDLAAAGMQPAHLLGRLEHTASELGDVVYATCAYAVIDPAEGCATVALAGHLPPVLAMSDGVTRVPELPAGLSLGLGNGVFGDVRIKLPPGSVLALFTDGLVETRTRPFDLGVRALRDMLAEVANGSLDEACDAIVGSLAPEREDDTTIVLVRVPACDPA